MKKSGEFKQVCQNKKAYHDFFIEKKMEAGICLLGSEVKSLRGGKAHLNDAYVDIKAGAPILVNAHISPYGHATHLQHEALRDRPLLLSRQEIKRIEKELKVKGCTVVPLQIYFKGPYAKVEIALAKGKKEYDKREDIKTRVAVREMSRDAKVRR
jgi:SsrA-binding protein